MRFGVGIEIGGTKLQVGLGQGGSTLTRCVRRTVEPGAGAERIRTVLQDLVPSILGQAGIAAADVAGIGIGFGGPVDSRRGIALVSHQVEGWAFFPLKKWAEESWSIPTKVQNDASLAGYAEAMVGAGQGCDRVFYMTIGSGIGGGLIDRGVIDEGQGLGAGEIGHTWLPDPGTGKPEKLELVCSGWSIARRARQRVLDGQQSILRDLVGGDLEKISAKTVYQAAESADSLSLAILAETCETLGLAIANVIALLHPERVIIGGGVSLMGNLFWDRLRDSVARRVFGPFRDSWCVSKALLGEDVVVVGGVLLAVCTKVTH